MSLAEQILAGKGQWAKNNDNKPAGSSITDKGLARTAKSYPKESARRRRVRPRAAEQTQPDAGGLNAKAPPRGQGHGPTPDRHRDHDLLHERACDLSGAQGLRRTVDQGRSGSATGGSAGSGRCTAGACLATGSAGTGRCAAACVVTAPTPGQAARGRNTTAAFGEAAGEAGQAGQANHLRLAAQPRLEEQALVLDLHVLKSPSSGRKADIAGRPGRAVSA